MEFFDGSDVSFVTAFGIMLVALVGCFYIALFSATVFICTFDIVLFYLFSSTQPRFLLLDGKLTTLFPLTFPSFHLLSSSSSSASSLFHFLLRLSIFTSKTTFSPDPSSPLFLFSFSIQRQQISSSLFPFSLRLFVLPFNHSIFFSVTGSFAIRFYT